MRQIAALRALLLLVFGLSMSACMPKEADRIGQAASEIVGGTAATGDPAVVLLVATSANQQSELLCTAELVSPHVLMTAAHCVDPQAVGTVSSFDAFFGSDVNGAEGSDPSNWIHIAETHFNANFDPSIINNGQDIAVAILAQPTTVTPIPLNTAALTSPLVGQTIRMVGFGVSSGQDQEGTTAGVKRQATTPLVSFDDNFVQFGTAQTDTCDGDSGGPAFMTLNGVEVIVGITSFGDVDCVQGSYDTRVDTVAQAFVAPFMAELDPSGSTGGQAPSAPKGVDAGVDAGDAIGADHEAGGSVAPSPVRRATGCSVSPSERLADGRAGWLAAVFLGAAFALRRRPASS